jgi:sec-independent protein translocase protein TatC
MHMKLSCYLIEFRKRLIRCLLVFLSIFFGLLYVANDIFTYLAKPLLHYLPAEHGLIATHILSPIFVPLELTFFLALFCTIPMVFYQCWSFITPALYAHEKRLIWPLLLISISLFYIGVVFAYFVIFPLLFGFLTQSVPLGVQIAPDIAQYLLFSLKFLFVFGMVFEVPVITIVLIKSGAVTRERLIQLRPYIIVAAFIMGMLLTPPDVVSQVVVAIPLWLLFELGILLSPFFVRKPLCVN